MFMKMTRWAFVMGVAAVGPLWAEQVALVMGNERYQDLSDVVGGRDVLLAAGALRDVDVAVVGGQDVRVDEMRRLSAQFEQMAPAADGLLVALSGRFVHSATDTFFLPVNSDGSSLTDVSAQSLSLSSILTFLAKVPGHAVLMLATDEDDGSMGRYLNSGIGDVTVPQGVTVLRATPRVAAQVMRDTLSRRGEDLTARVENRPGVEGRGFLPSGHSFLPAEGGSTSAELWAVQAELRAVRDRLNRVEADAKASLDRANRAESAFWDAMQEIDTEDAYGRYLTAFPDGRFSEAANRILGEIRGDPFRDARRGETALNLNRDQRRQIQRDLTTLGFSTRGVDGIFGNGTRAAIRGWQTERGLSVSGFLNANQLRRLSQEATAQAEARQQEEAARQAESERRDRALWEDLGRGGNEAGLRQYLDRFPSGIFADRARARLAQIDAAREPQVDRREEQMWNRAHREDSIDAYRRYLEFYPGGKFSEEAETRIAALEGQDSGNSAAELGEKILGLNDLTRRTVEARLESMGLKPGPVDGTFDENTRRAIRQYQESSGLPSTGYLSKATVVRLLADSVRNIFQ